MADEDDFRLEAPAAAAVAVPSSSAAAVRDEDDFSLIPNPAPDAAAAADVGAAAAEEPEVVVDAAPQMSFIGQHTDSALMQLETLEKLIRGLGDNEGCPICFEPMVSFLRVILKACIVCCFMGIVVVVV